jgi:hypothetical protein
MMMMMMMMMSLFPYSRLTPYISTVKTPPQTSPQAHADGQQKHA